MLENVNAPELVIDPADAAENVTVTDAYVLPPELVTSVPAAVAEPLVVINRTLMGVVGLVYDA
jgi:hypothetical protein